MHLLCLPALQLLQQQQVVQAALMVDSVAAHHLRQPAAKQQRLEQTLAGEGILSSVSVGMDLWGMGREGERKRGREGTLTNGRAHEQA
jgi:hypothetical protein